MSKFAVSAFSIIALSCFSAAATAAPPASVHEPGVAVSQTAMNTAGKVKDMKKTTPGQKAQKEVKMQKDLGGLPPEEALRYMETTPGVIIVNIAGRGWYQKNHFEGSLDIPAEDIGEEETVRRLMALPKDRPVILHCRRGNSVIPWYNRMKEIRKDVPELSYIAGVPPFEAYNRWARANKPQ